ncbi:MAG: phosphotransferase [Microlunatus sp.]
MPASADQVGKLTSIPAEELQVRLRAYFAAQSPEEPTSSVGPLKELKGGWANSLYAFTLQQGGSNGQLPRDLVIKMYSPDARGLEHADREWRALTQLGATGYPVPRIECYELGGRSLGRPFIVMDSIPGIAFWDVFEAADPAGQTRLTQKFVAPLVALHEVEPRVLWLRKHA